MPWKGAVDRKPVEGQQKYLDNTFITEDMVNPVEQTTPLCENSGEHQSVVAKPAVEVKDLNNTKEAKPLLYFEVYHNCKLYIISQ